MPGQKRKTVATKGPGLSSRSCHSRRLRCNGPWLTVQWRDGQGYVRVGARRRHHDMSLPSECDGLSDIDPATVESTEDYSNMMEVVDMTFTGCFRAAFESLDSVDLRRTMMRRLVLTTTTSTSKEGLQPFAFCFGGTFCADGIGESCIKLKSGIFEVHFRSEMCMCPIRTEQHPQNCPFRRTTTFRWHP